MNVAGIIGRRIFLWHAPVTLDEASWDALYRLGLHFGMIG